MDVALVVVVKTSAGMRVLESEVTILLDAEPVRVQVTRVTETLELELISYELHGSAAALLDDLESVVKPGDSAGAAKEAIQRIHGARKVVRDNRVQPVGTLLRVNGRPC